MKVAICMRIIVVYFWCSCNLVNVNAMIGVNLGIRYSLTPMVPSVVVDLLLQNQVKAVKLLDSDDDIIEAFSGTDIEVSLTFQNASRSIKNQSDATRFVETKIKHFPKVKFKYIVIATNAFFIYRFTHVEFSTIIDTLQFIQSALDQMGYGHIKVTLSNTSTGALNFNATKPSEAEFANDLNNTMPKILDFLNRTGAPFMFDFFPIVLASLHKIYYNFSFPDNNSSFSVNDTNGLVYRNAFDYVHDSFLWAIRKSGYESMKLVAGMICWPTDGFPYANVQTAERFWRSMLLLAASNRGTPMKPGVTIDIFILSLTDEKYNDPFLAFRRHWGIYKSNGEPKFRIDLSGQGRDIYPTSAKGINLMPARWCVYNENDENMTRVFEQYELACNGSDCTTMAPFGSCSILTPNERISYAFNSYFQAKYQDENVCLFAGLGKLTVSNPSRDGCEFTIEVVRNSHKSEDSIW